ncbi:MAG TPA: putative sulfate exporter family transporter [bacterium]|jgi:uncharacterized integral membrane protein (TIGR00698 family)
MTKQACYQILLVLLLVICALPVISAPLALLLGVAFALTVGNPAIDKTRSATHKLLQGSVIGLGFGMNATVALEVGSRGLLFTVAGILLTFTLGFLISRALKVDKTTSYLISTGTAICGGSAIAAVAPAIGAKSENTSVALGVVFILNSVALLLFPVIGHKLNLSQEQFGLWSAIAIHDTSSVVGAASQYGKEALQAATTIKLTRALWIIPVTLISAVIFKSGAKGIKIPYFIFAFFAAMLLNTYLVAGSSVFHIIYLIAKQGLVVTLFLIGANLSRATLKSVGFRPFVMGIILWIAVSSLTLLNV